MTAMTMASEMDNISVASFSSHDGNSSKMSNSKRTASSSGKTEEHKRLRKDPWIQSLRFLSLCILLVVAYVVAMTVYVSLKESEQRSFETKFHDQASQLGETLRNELAVKLQALDALSVSVSAYAAAQTNTSWPNIHMAEFGFRSASTLKMAKAISVGLHPIVRRDQLGSWLEYASANHESWRQAGFDFQQAFPDAVPEERRGEDAFLSNIRPPSDYVFSINDEGNPTQYEGDVMVPVWQHSPVDQGLPYINEDQLKLDTDTAALQEILANQTAVLGIFYDLSETIYGHEYERLGARYQDSEWADIWQGDLANSEFEQAADENGDSRRGINPQLQGPAANLWYPVFSSFQPNATNELVAVLSLTTKWDAFFLAHLPPDANGLLVVVSNTCGQVFTFEVMGDTVEYLGPEDYHDDEEYDYYQDTFEVFGEESIYTGTPVSQSYCHYYVDVFPSDKMRKQYSTNNPRSFTLGVACIFMFTIVVFIFYDYLVERRQRFLAEAADRSNAIVSSLFPKIVRDRLFDDADPKSSQDKKSQFKNDQAFGAGALVPTGGPTARQSSAPIADLFANTTVMFGDIAGFTAWSSSRQPSEVFILLEALYGAFDKLAKDMEVFKVETIGDCYMAVTGLPNAQDDHHLRMVRFARHALQKMNVLTSELEVRLGPDTIDLKFRVGLHSGPVTAGVLRGEKSRFQLFGDTVNTASRMESTGKPNLIQVSQATADLIIASGKSHWLKKRENLVQAKGKGEVQTYWIKTKASSSAGKSSDTFEVPSEDGDTETHVSGSNMFFANESGDDMELDLGGDSSSDSNDSNDGLEDSFKALGIRRSLIDWQVDVLSRLLKQIVVHRENMSFRSRELPLDVKANPSAKPRQSIVESIHMPDYGAWNLSDSTGVDNTELPKVVMDQLEDLITAIAQLYRQNSFHNFEHACHVTMSANKLLKRIVSPDRKSCDLDESIRMNHDTTFGLASDPLTQFAIIFSAIIHDVDHSGVSNGQLAKEQNRIAVMYNNQSVAEQNSIDLTFEILTSGVYTDLLDCICADQEEFQRFRQLVINCVMATDIFDKELKEFRNNRWAKAFSDETTTDLKATIVIEHIIQAADVAHTMQHWHVYQRWNEMLFQEMCKAYEAGRGAANDPADGWYDGELWFFDNYVIPLAKKLDDCGVFGVSSDECLTYAVENRTEWEAKGKSIVEEMKAKYHPKHVKWEDQGEEEL